MLIHMPAGAVKIVFGKSPYIKRYTSTPQPALEGRAVDIMQGNVVGGGSSVNAMTYARGSKDDYDRWNTLSGDAGWGWDDLVPYFRKQEGNVRLENAAHSGDGPLKVSDPAYISEAANIFVRTLQKLKVPFTDDFTGGQLQGVGYEQSTTFRGKRRSSADSFGTCRMGKADDATTVVTPDLRVKGIDGLRIMDASIMPRIISANTNATVMAVADKGVDLLTGTYTGRVAAAQ